MVHSERMTQDRSLKGRQMKFFWQKKSAAAQNSQQSGESTSQTPSAQPYAATHAKSSGIIATKDIDDYTYEVVGESFQHDHLVQLAQIHKAIDEGSIFTTATLKLQPENVFDPTAVMVIVEGLQVGYIAKSQSSDVTANIKRQHTTELEVPAHLGWDTENPQPYIGVKLMMGDLI